MRTPILLAACRLLIPLLLLFSFFLLVRGHNSPGGGFAGGLIAAGAFCLDALIRGIDSALEELKVRPGTLAGVGIAIALASAVSPLLLGAPFFTGLWTSPEGVARGITLGTPLLFDLGVYLTVLGVVLRVVFSFMES